MWIFVLISIPGRGKKPNQWQGPPKIFPTNHGPNQKIVSMGTLPETNISLWKLAFPIGKLIFQAFILRGENVSFRRVSSGKPCSKDPKPPKKWQFRRRTCSHSGLFDWSTKCNQRTIGRLTLAWCSFRTNYINLIQFAWLCVKKGTPKIMAYDIIHV